MADDVGPSGPGQLMSLLFSRRSADVAGSLGDDPWRIPANSEQGGAGVAGVAVNTTSAQRQSAVWASVRLRADMISTLPFDVYRRRRGGVAEEVDPPAVLVSPHGNGLSMLDWLWSSQWAVDLRGNSYGEIVDLDAMGRPTQIELWNPDLVQTWKDRDTGRVLYRYNGKLVPAEKVWHERAFVPAGSHVGMSVIEHAATTISTSLAANIYGGRWFANGGQPPGVFQQTAKTLKSDEAEVISDRLVDRIRRRRPLVIGSDWQYTPLGLSANDGQFLETQKASVQDVARFFGVQPEMIGSDSGSSLTYANIEQRSLHFLLYSLNPALRRREEALSRLTPAGQYVRFNRKALLETDTLSRLKAFQIAQTIRLQTPAEQRALEDQAPLTDEQWSEFDRLKPPPTITLPAPSSDD